MNILIFNWRDLKHNQSGGAELYLHEQAKIWAKVGHKITWVTSNVPGQPKEEKVDGIRFIRLGGQMGVYLLAPIIYFREARNIDLIIDAENGIPFFTPLFSRKKKLLLIHHIHKDVWFKGDVGFFVSRIGYFLETKLMPLVYRNVPIVAVSPSSKNNVLELMPRSKVDIIHNAISDKYIPGVKSKKPEVVFLGRLKKYKSVDILLKAIAKVDRELVVNIVGRGDDEKRLKEVTQKLGLKKVIFHGFVSEEDKIKILQRSWIALNPSFVEGWSITNVEASACGVPVIGSNVAGIKDSVIHGKTGFLFEYGNVDELANRIKELLGNKTLMREMENNSIEWAKNFSWEKSAKKFLQIFKRLKRN